MLQHEMSAPATADTDGSIFPPGSPPRTTNSKNTASNKFMIPEDAVPQLSFVLRKMDSIMLDDPNCAPADALKVAKNQYEAEFLANLSTKEKYRVHGWNLEKLVDLSRSSPTLQMCKDLETHMLDLLRELSNLLIWRKEVFEQRLLPLQHFTHLSVVCSRLAREKGTVECLQSLLISQVRALFVESSDEGSLILHKEVLMRQQNAMSAQQEIERMYHANDHLRKELSTSRSSSGWIRMILTQEIRLLEKRNRMYLRDLAVYIEQVKDKMNIKKILSMKAKDLGIKEEQEELEEELEVLQLEQRPGDPLEVSNDSRDSRVISPTSPRGTAPSNVQAISSTPLKSPAYRRQSVSLDEPNPNLSSPAGKRKSSVDAEVHKRKDSLLKHVSDKISTYEEQVKMREAKLVQQQANYRDAVREYEEGAAELKRKTAITDARFVEVTAREKKVEEAEQRLEDSVKSLDARFDVMETLQQDLTRQARGVEATARDELLVLSKHAADDVAKQAQFALLFAVEASAYIKNTKIYPGETDWTKIVKVEKGKNLNSPVNPSFNTSNPPVSPPFNKKESSPASSIGSERDGNREDHFSDAHKSIVSGYDVKKVASVAERNPTVEAFVNFLDGLDHDKQDELRVAIIENRLLASDDSMQMRQANLELSESRVQELEEERYRLNQQINQLQGEVQELSNLSMQAKFSPENMPDSNEERENFRQEMLKKEEDLKQKFSRMRTEIREQEALITKEQATLMARAQGLEAGEKDLQARKLEVEKRESSVKDLEKHLTSALEKATAEQRAFEETSSSKLNQLQDKEKVITEKLNDLRALESDESRMEAILVLKQTIAEKEKVVRDKDRVIAKLEKELHASAATMRETVDALVDKAAEGLVKEMNKKEEKIEKREELVSAQSNRVEAEKAKIHDLARAEKALKEADNKLKRANELVAMNTKREEELLALAKQLDRERTAGAGKNKEGANLEDLDKMATAYDHRISALSKQIKDLKDNETKLLAKIQRLEKSSRGTPSSTPSNTLGGRKTGLANWSWSLQDQFADPENPTKEELRDQAIRINEAHADCVKDIEERYRKLMDAESELKAQKDESDALKLRKEEIDQREAALTSKHEAISAVAGKIEGLDLERMSRDEIDALRQRLKIEMDQNIAEYEKAKQQHRLRMETLEDQIRDTEEDLVRNVKILKSKSKFVEYVQDTQEAQADHAGYMQRSTQLKSLLSSSDTHISHLIALKEIYLEKLAEISAQVEDRKFVMENEEKQEQDDMRSMLKAIEKQEHDYLARVAQQNAHKPQPAVRKKDPEKVSSLPAIYPSISLNPAKKHLGGGFNMNRALIRTAPILRQSMSAPSQHDMAFYQQLPGAKYFRGTGGALSPGQQHRAQAQARYSEQREWVSSPLNPIPEPIPMGHDS